MGIMSTARRKVWWMVALVVLSLVVSGCSGIKPYEPRNNREEGPEKGLFTGSEGEFVIYRKAEELQKDSETSKKADETADGEQQKLDSEDKQNPNKPESAAQPVPARDGNE